MEKIIASITNTLKPTQEEAKDCFVCYEVTVKQVYRCNLCEVIICDTCAIEWFKQELDQ